VSRVSGTNEVSDGNETNDPATVSDEHENENETAPAEATAAPKAHEPHIQILKGRPTAAEVAALVTVLGGASGAAAPPEQPERTRWGLPVDKLRFAVINHQRVTLQERKHMER
jgi:Acyl-CoA carboxylase epsilon subunit